VHLTAENMAAAEREGLEKRFKIATTISTSNMVCFDPVRAGRCVRAPTADGSPQEGRIKKYSDAGEILQEFFAMRLEYYNLRKSWLSEQLMAEFNKLDNKVGARRARTCCGRR
jgi:DNA topoisomerase-2